MKIVLLLDALGLINVCHHNELMLFACFLLAFVLLLFPFTNEGLMDESLLAQFNGCKLLTGNYYN